MGRLILHVKNALIQLEVISGGFLNIVRIDIMLGLVRSNHGGYKGELTNKGRGFGGQNNI